MNTNERLKRYLIESNYITAVWTWFMVLSGKAAEPVLVASVLYASVKLLPIVHFPPQLDVAVFIAQFVALDIGGLSLNKLADQAKQDGNPDGAKQAKRLSVALVIIMLIGVIMAGVNTIVHIDNQASAVIDTTLLIARAILAVLYGRVIHSLRHEEPFAEVEQPTEAMVERMIWEIVERVIRDEFRPMIEAMVAARVQEMVPKTEPPIMEEQPDLPMNVRPLQKPKDTKEVDEVVWPLLNTGMTVRAIAQCAGTSTATVGRSRKRWERAQAV